MSLTDQLNKLNADLAAAVTAQQQVNTDQSALLAAIIAQLSAPPPPPPPPPAGPVFYVSPSGSDTAAGTLAAPWKTVGKGVTALTPGATLYLRGGTYAEAIGDSIPSGTDWTAPVTISGYTGEAAILAPPSGSIGVRISTHAYIALQNLTLDGTHLTTANNGVVKVTYSSSSAYAHHVRLSGCEIKSAPAGSGVLITSGAGGPQVGHNEILNCTIHDNGGTNPLYHGIYTETCDNVFSGNTIYNNAGYGVQIYCSGAANGSTVNCARNVVGGNKIYSQKTRAGVIVCYGVGNLVFNSILWDNGDGGIYLSYNPASTFILNNTIWKNRQVYSTRGIQIDGGSTGSVVQNNISWQNVSGDWIDNGTGTTQDHNLFGIDPLFVNAAGGDFHLQPGSPAIDAGVALTQVPVDFDGVARPQGAGVDIGCYER